MIKARKIIFNQFFSPFSIRRLAHALTGHLLSRDPAAFRAIWADHAEADWLERVAREPSLCRHRKSPCRSRRREGEIFSGQQMEKKLTPASCGPPPGVMDPSQLGALVDALQMATLTFRRGGCFLEFRKLKIKK
jgi:hypothetical protein